MSSCAGVKPGVALGRTVLLSGLETVSVCDLCHATEFSAELTHAGWKLVRCISCGLVFTSPRYPQEHLFQLYETSYYQKAKFYLSAQCEAPSDDEMLLARALLKRCGANSRNPKPRALEVGCGGGRLLDAFGRVGWEAVGLEKSLVAAASAMSRGLDARSADIIDPSLGFFELVVAFHLLEHVHSPRTFIGNCVERLVAGGFILIEVPDYGSVRSRQMRENWPFLYPDLHLYQFTEETLTRYLRRSDLRVEFVQRVGGKGPVEVEQESAVPNAANRAGSGLRWQSAIKARIFALRRLVWWSRSVRGLIRNLIWNHLGYGDYLRVLARKI